MEPIKADVFPGPSIHGPGVLGGPAVLDDPNRPEGFNFESLQEKAEKIQANMNTRRSTAGAVVVRYHLEPTKVQIFLRCSDQKLDVRRKRIDFGKKSEFIFFILKNLSISNRMDDQHGPNWKQPQSNLGWAIHRSLSEKISKLKKVSVIIFQCGKIVIRSGLMHLIYL